LLRAGFERLVFDSKDEVDGLGQKCRLSLYTQFFESGLKTRLGALLLRYHDTLGKAGF
jgi:hypothetical protein